MNKNRFIKVFVFMIVSFFGISNVFASSVVLKSTSTSVTRGNTVTITTTVNADSGIYTIEGSMSCKGAGVNGGISLTYEDMNTASRSKSFTHTIKPTSSGVVTCTTSNVKIRELAKDSNYQLSNSTITIKVNDPVVIPPKVYSSDNALSSLSIEGYNINPKFSKDVLEYKLEVDQSIEKIKITAKANDKKASVSGVGEKTLTPGNNTFEVKVIAENGNSKIYKIVINSVDQNPIVVNIDNKKYTVIKKNNKVIDSLSFYKEDVVKINDQDVVSYHNDKSGVTLVILKDENNKVNYYVYDAIKNEYQLYREYKFGNITLYLLDIDEKILPNGYLKYDLVIGEDKLFGYKLSKDSKFYLINAMNVETGNKSLYLYDEEEGTVQRYDDDISKYFSASATGALVNYKNYLAISLSICGALVVVLIVVLIINSKKNREKIRKK